MPLLNYPGKILFVAFLGVHVPLIALIVFFTLHSYEDWRSILTILVVALVATLLGTAVTLVVLRLLLKPIMVASWALRSYRATRILPNLPLEYSDEAGRLMRDTDATIRELDSLLDRLTYFDPVTGLPNRAQLSQKITDMITEGTPFTMVCVRLANHGEVEAFLDIDASDQVILTLADRLRANALPLEIGRVGSDSFKFAMPLLDRATLQRRLSHLSVELTAPIVCGRHLFHPRVSIGAAWFPEHGTDASTVMGAAMSAATVREFGNGSNVAFYSATTDTTARRRFLLDQEIREALEHDEFELHFQPIVDLDEGRVVAAESLLRWKHPQYGMIPPDEFIPVAEATGLIVPLGGWVLQAACRQIAEWSGPEAVHPTVSINISARQFRDPDLIRKIDEAVETHKVDYSRLKIEITETVLLADLHTVSRTLHEIRERGIRLSLDDFGAEYSNMGYIAQFTFDEMKIDRMFVDQLDRDERRRAICTAIATLSRGLHMPVVAEGIERPEEVAVLRELGVNLFQGYYFSRPVPASAFGAACEEIARGFSSPQYRVVSA